MAIRISAPKLKLPFPLARVRRAAQLFLKAHGVIEADLSIVFLPDKDMRALNRKSLGHDYVTDVVTFDLRDKTPAVRHKAQDTRHKTDGGSGLSTERSSALCPVPGALEAEIYICPGEARRNAKLFGEPFEREVLRYVAHGILHLLGHEDHVPAGREKMRVLENELLALLTYPG